MEGNVEQVLVTIYLFVYFVEVASWLVLVCNTWEWMLHKVCLLFRRLALCALCAYATVSFCASVWIYLFCNFFHKRPSLPLITWVWFVVVTLRYFQLRHIVTPTLVAHCYPQFSTTTIFKALIICVKKGSFCSLVLLTALWIWFKIEEFCLNFLYHLITVGLKPNWFKYDPRSTNPDLLLHGISSFMLTQISKYQLISKL
jgi:hypothetical protein